jgi:hypothetical protein
MRALLFAGCLLVGCAGRGQPTDDTTSTLMSVPADLPGCDAHQNTPHGVLTAIRVAGQDDLVVVFDEGRPLCVDVLEAAARSLHSFIVLGAANSNPMPGSDPENSNPMPGNPGDPASSNPMPGSDPGGSNPMPGKG